MVSSQVPEPLPDNFRVADTDRALVLDTLSQAYVAGQLSWEEHEGRAVRAQQAKTHQELAPLTLDLVRPAPSNPLAPSGVSPGNSQTHNFVDGSEPDCKVISVFGGSTRKGLWRVPARITVFDLFGGSDIDLTQAQLTSKVITVNQISIFGGSDFKVPEGMNVVDETVCIFGGNSTKNLAPQNGGPTLVLRGFALFGGCDIRGPKSGRAMW